MHGGQKHRPYRGFSNLNTDSWSYPAGEEMAILEMAEEVCNEEATKHQAHGQQGSVGEGPFKQLVNGLIAFWM